MKGAAMISSSTKRIQANDDAKRRQLLQAHSVDLTVVIQFTGDGLADLRHELEDAIRFDKEGTRE